MQQNNKYLYADNLISSPSILKSLIVLGTRMQLSDNFKLTEEAYEDLSGVINSEEFITQFRKNIVTILAGYMSYSVVSDNITKYISDEIYGWASNKEYYNLIGKTNIKILEVTIKAIKKIQEQTGVDVFIFMQNNLPVAYKEIISDDMYNKIYDYLAIANKLEDTHEIVETYKYLYDYYSPEELRKCLLDSFKLYVNKSPTREELEHFVFENYLEKEGVDLQDIERMKDLLASLPVPGEEDLN